MKHAIACLLILTLVIPAEARERTPLEQARKIARDAKVRVELKSENTMFGRLGEITETKFKLEPHSEEVKFQDVSRIRSVEPGKKEILLKPLQALALIPIAVVCGLGAIFRKPCDL